MLFILFQRIAAGRRLFTFLEHTVERISWAQLDLNSGYLKTSSSVPAGHSWFGTVANLTQRREYQLDTAGFEQWLS